MGLLTNAGDPGSGPIKVLSQIRKWSWAVCGLLYVGGLVYFGVLHWPSFHGKTYFSENALLPGLVDEEFMHSKTLAAYAREAKKAILHTQDKGKTNGYFMPHDWLEHKFQEVGLEGYSQNFSVHLPLAGVKELNGKNVYGILRAPRSSSSEALVISLPYRMNSHNLLGLIFALAEFCRAQIYWAKDIIFVVAEHEDLGMEAWISAYHHRKIPNLPAQPLAARGGAIQAGVSVELGTPAGPFSHVDLRFHMVNGQLPNLDLINLVVRMAEKEALEPTLFKREERLDPFSYEGYLDLLGTSVRGLGAQALGRPTGLHGVFGRYGIEALTLEAYHKGQRRGREYHIGLEEVGRILEGTLRSLNNLLERFHQSFFFYVLPSSHRYISIGLYMPAVGLMALAPLLKACCLWADMVDATSPPKDNGDPPRADGAEKEDYSLLSVAPTLLLAHLTGIFLYYFPWIMMSHDSDGSVMVNGLAGFMVAIFFFPFLLKRKYQDPKIVGGPSPVVLRSVVLILLGLVLGVNAVLNFGLGFLLSVVTVPVALLCQARYNLVSRTITSILVVLVNPVVFVCLLNFSGVLMDSAKQPSLFVALTKTYDLTRIGVINVVADSLVHGSWLYAMTCLCLVPIWTLFWTLLHV